MKKYFDAILILATCAISEAQQPPAYPNNRAIAQPQAPKHCPAGFVLDSNGNCVRLEPDQLAD